MIDPLLDYYILCWNVEDINFTESENYCVTYYNGHLASFYDQTDMDSFISLRDNMELLEEILFGFYSKSGGEFVYTDNLQTNYDNWDDGQPDLSSSHELS